jgi:hypothetical protein
MMNTSWRHLQSVIGLGIVVVSFLCAASYAEDLFTPALSRRGQLSGYDAYRYHSYAERHCTDEVFDILQAENAPFTQAGYPTALTLLYKATAPEPLIGCALNWLLWLGAGLLLRRIVEDGDSSSLGFFTLWMLYPESFDWIGTTSKEPMVAFAGALALRLCLSQASTTRKLVSCAILSTLMFPVRWALLPLIAVALLTSLRFRRSSASPTWYYTLLVAVAATSALYVVGGNFETFSNPLEKVGHAHVQTALSEGLSEGSLLARAGSSNKFVDLLWVPVRGLTTVVAPLYISPLGADVETTLHWASAAICFLIVVAAVLRARRFTGWSQREAVLFSFCILGVVALGFTGLIHPRYRSLIAAGLLPLGWIWMRDEIGERGLVRLAFFGGVLPLAAALAYKGLRAM